MLLGILKRWKHPQKAYKTAGSLDPQDIMESSPHTHADSKLELLQGQAKSCSLWGSLYKDTECVFNYTLTVIL